MDRIWCKCNIVIFDHYNKGISRRLMLPNFILALLHRIVCFLLLCWSNSLATSSLRRYHTANSAEHLIIPTKINLYPLVIGICIHSEWNNFGISFHINSLLRSLTFLLYLNTDFSGYFRLKLSPTSGGCPWLLILLKDLLY